MNKIKIFCSWDIGMDHEFDKQVELYVDQIPNTIIPSGVTRFVYLLEPPEIMDLSHQAIIGAQHNTFNHLFTHNQYLIDNCDRATLVPFGTTWIKDYGFPEKRFEVSILVGGKLMAPGHHLRHKVWFKENRIISPKNFYLSGNFGGIENYNDNPVLGDDKTPLFDSQFHICIENAKRDNWFTEKLIDCLITKTVPIYWGCPNIGDWFDTRGFIIVNSLSDIIESSNTITPDKYAEMLPFIENNYKIAQDYVNLGDIINREILKKL